MGLTAGNAAGYRGGAINTGIEDFLVLPAADQLLRQRLLFTSSDVAASLPPAVAAAAIYLNKDVAASMLPTCCGSGSLSLTYGPTSRGQRFRQRHQRNDVSAFLKPAVPAEAFGKSRALRIRSGLLRQLFFPCGQ